jgi:hypothetical protein
MMDVRGSLRVLCLPLLRYEATKVLLAPSNGTDCA